MNKQDIKLYDELYKSNWNALFHMARHILHSESLSEELTQNTLMVCFFKFEEVKMHPNPERWLKKVMRNLIGNEIKKLRVRNEHLDSSFINCWPSTEPDAKLEEVLPSGLSDKDKQLLIWAYDDLLSCGEIASRLNISESACRTRLCRARERCGEIMQKNKLCL